MTTAAPGTSAPSPTVRSLWTRSRGPLLALLLLVISGVVLAALQSGEQHGRLDPRSADRTGSRAIARLLASHDVSTQVVTTSEEAAAAAGPDTTLLVTSPDMLTQDQLTGLHTATAHTPGRTVLLAPGPSALETFAPGVRTDPPAGISARRPACSLPEARRAGDALLGGLSYTTSVGRSRSLLPQRRPAHPAAPAGSPAPAATPCSSAPPTSSTTTTSPSTATPRWPFNSSVRTSIWSGTSPP